MPGDEDTRLDVWSLTESRFLWHCELPLPANNFSIRFLRRSSTNKGPNCPTRYAQLFVPDPIASILAIVFGTITTVDMEHFTVILSIHSFLKMCYGLCAATKGENINSETVPVFSWEQWGPSVTRWLPLEIRGEYGSHMVYGSRMLATFFQRRDAEGEDAYYNMLMDFNPRPIRRKTLEQCGDHVLISTIDYASRWGAHGKGLMSNLPYRAWVSTSAYRYWNLDLEANAILGRLVKHPHVILYSFCLLTMYRRMRIIAFLSYLAEILSPSKPVSATRSKVF